MRSPDEKRIKEVNVQFGTWSIKQGDYKRKSYPGEKSFRTFSRNQKWKRSILTITLIMLGYGALVLLLNFLTKF